MFDKLEGLVDRLDTVLQELNDPRCEHGDQNRFRDLMKEQNAIWHLSWKSIRSMYRKSRTSRKVWMLLEEESDEEMKELAKEELTESKANVEAAGRGIKVFF